MTATVLELPVTPTAHPDTETLTVGEWARDVVEACDRTPRETLDAAGRFRPNPARAPARRRAEAAISRAAHHLHIPLTEIGPCATCRAYTHRYGDRGGPLCPACAGRLRGPR